MKFLSLITIIGCAVVVQCRVTLPEGYTEDPDSGKLYKLMYHALPWDQAKLKCLEKGAKLAVPTSEEEFRFLQTMVRGMKYHDIIGTEFKLVVWLGINNLDNYSEWVNLEGKNINDSGFHQWTEGNGEISDNPKEPHCAVLDAHNFGLRDFWCHRSQPYICEISTRNSGNTNDSTVN